MASFTCNTDAPQNTFLHSNHNTHHRGHSMSRSFSSTSSHGPTPLLLQTSYPSHLSHLSHPSPSLGASPLPSLSTPTSPVKSSFSSPMLRLPSSSTFASYHDPPIQYLPSSSENDPLPLPPIDTTLPPTNPSGYARTYTKSFSVGTPHHPSQSQPQVRRIKTSMSALANLDPSRLALRNYDPKADTSLIAIRVRYVSKDLWIRIDIPRNIPVHQARDLILKKCQLTLAPPSAPSSLAETSLQDDDTTPTELNYQAMNHLAPSLDAIFSGTIDVTKSQRTPEDKPLASPDPNKTPTNKTQKANGDIKTSHSDNSISKSLASQSSGSDKETPRSPTSIDDERRLNAEKLVERLAMFSDCLNGFGEEANVNYAKSIVTVPSGHVKDPPSKGTSSLKRLLSHSSTSHDETTPNNPSDKRLVNIGWASWRDRHNSQSGKHFERGLPALSDIMADCPEDGQPASESMKKECESWRASFGLFWVANGHWLDDSRLISSYNLEPYDLLELQLRNHYIQLPPPGGHLNYSDHYAEGVLFKLSKKSKPVSMLTSNGKDSTGVWKERWVVLQGTKLLIYHKRKDTTKKTIQLPTPLQMVTRVLPPNSRHQFKFTMSTAATMSSTLIALDMSSDPNAPKLCFRGASENELSHWIRIFNSLNNEDPLRSPVFDLDGPASARPDQGSSTANGTSGFSPERKRNHTSQSIGSNSTTINFISPTLISNAMVAFSNLNGSHTQQGGNDYHRSLSHGGLADRNDAPLQHHSLVGKEDSRRRAITEPHLNIPQSRNKHAAKGSLTGMDSQLRSMDVSNVSEAPFRLDSPPGRKRRPVLGTEYLDNASQVLLASSSARSSTAPLYSGYIWLYVPPTSKDTGTKDHHASESGRYVKCFAAINDQGHFQWVEVKKQTDLETEQESKSEAGAGPIAPSRSSYGIQLKPKKDTNQRLPPLPSSDSSERDGGSPVSPNAEVVQATMAHKLRLFFFCIRISQEALAQVMLEMASESPTSRSQNKTPPSSSKTRHRLSSSISALGSSALPPLPLKSQSLSGSVSKGMSKNSTWPAMAPLQQIHHDRSHEGYGALLFPEKPLTTSPGSQSRPVSHRRSSTSLKSSKDDGAMSPSSSVDMGSSSDVVVRAQFLQKAAALTRQLSISSSGDKQDHSTLSPPSSSPSSSKARLSLGETVSAKKADIPDSALAYESVIHDRASQGLGRLDTHRNEDNELLSKCPFLETSEDVGRGQKVTLKGYAETEEGWKILQSALERFIDPVQDQLSALPPEDTLIPSYTLLTSPETRLSEKAEMYLSAKATLLEEANLHASMAAAAVATSVSESLEVRSPTPDQVTVSSAPYGPTAPKGTSVLHRLMNLSGGGDRDKSKGSTPTSPMPEQYNRQALFVDSNVPGSPLTPTGTGMSIKRGVSPGGPLSQSVGAATGLLRPRPRLNQQRSADELTKMSGYYAQSDFKNGGIGLGMYSTSTAIGDSGSSNGQPPHHRLRPRGKYRPQDEQDYSKLDEGHHHHHHHPSHHYFVSTNNNSPVPRSMSLTAATSSHHVNTMVMLAGESDKFPKRASRSSMYSLQSPMITHGHGGRDDDEGDFKGGIVSGIMDLDNVMSNDNHLNHPSDQDHGSRNTSPSSSSPSPSSSSGKQSSLAKDNQGKFSPLIVSSPRMTGRGIGGGDHEVLQHPFDSHSRHEDDGELSKMAQGRDSNQNGRSSHNHHHHHRHHHHHLSMDKDKSKKPHTVLGAGKAAVSGVFGKIRKSVG